MKFLFDDYSTNSIFVSKSSPAQPRKGVPKLYEDNIAPVFQQPVLLENYAQKSAQDEFHIHPDWTSQVLIEDNFSEVVDIIDEYGHKEPGKSTTATDWAQQEMASLTHASIVGKLPSTSFVHSDSLPSPANEVPDGGANPPKHKRSLILDTLFGLLLQNLKAQFILSEKRVHTSSIHRLLAKAVRGTPGKQGLFESWQKLQRKRIIKSKPDLKVQQNQA